MGIKRIKNLWYFYVVSIFVKKPIKQLTWSVKDFNQGKLWAKTQRDPSNPNKSLWDLCYEKRNDSVETLHNINQYI
jgi:hypothetical protein